MARFFGKKSEKAIEIEADIPQSESRSVTELNRAKAKLAEALASRSYAEARKIRQQIQRLAHQDFDARGTVAGTDGAAMNASGNYDNMV